MIDKTCTHCAHAKPLTGLWRQYAHMYLHCPYEYEGRQPHLTGMTSPCVYVPIRWERKK